MLLLAVLLGYLEAAKAGQYMRPILGGVALAAVATVLTVLLMPTIFGLLPVGREVLEAITALLAVVVLFYVSFWLIAAPRQQALARVREGPDVAGRVDRLGRRRSCSSASPRSTARASRRRSSTRRCSRSARVSAPTSPSGSGSASSPSPSSSYAMFRLGRKMPIKMFMNTAVALRDDHVGGVPRQRGAHAAVRRRRSPTPCSRAGPALPIFVAEATGYWPTLQVVVAQFALAFVYIAGAIYVFVVKPRLARRAARPSPVAAAPQAA